MAIDPMQHATGELELEARFKAGQSADIPGKSKV